jgi:replicative DNA helicase
MTAARFQSGDAFFNGWRDGVTSGIPPPLYPLADASNPVSGIQIGPGRVLLCGGGPGMGKTAFVTQHTFEALRLTPTLRALICNVEMTPSVLLDRQLSRISGVDLDTVSRRRWLPEHEERRGRAFATMRPLIERTAFMEPPYTLRHVAECATEFGAGLIVLDYVQRFSVGDDKQRDSSRTEIDDTMSMIRRFADLGSAVIVVSAVSRGKSTKGVASYGDEGLASFRGSSELEFGADDAFVLTPGEMGLVTLKHLKARHSEPKDLSLIFDKRVQNFRPMGVAA